MASIDVRIDNWKKRLLDLGKRNRLINYRETKRSSIRIISPDLDELFANLVLNENSLEFPFQYEDFNDDDLDEMEGSLISLGDIKTDQSLKEQQKTLRNLRNKAKIALEEQGINILYLSFGFLKWTESTGSDQVITSPIVLVPVSITLESISSPFVLRLAEDEIVVNPTLKYKMEHDFGVILPDFDAHEDNIREYLKNINKFITKNKWEVVNETGLSLLSFLKINMYEDLDKNQDRMKAHPFLVALSGDKGQIKTLPMEFNAYDHDKKTRAIDTYQVVDADSSQQDAILYAKKGISFVLQGPPGTGKSQTITNIIAESLAEGKSVLFVSEKMAALEVVYKRLSQVGLTEFCLNLHSHKASKKGVLDDLGKTLALNKFRIQDDTFSQLDLLEKQRDKLNRYVAELHTPIQPLNQTLYYITGKLAKLYESPDIIFSIDDLRGTTSEKLNDYTFLLGEFSKTIGKMSGDYTLNPWRNCIIAMVSHELRHDIETYLRKLSPKFDMLTEQFKLINDYYEFNRKSSLIAVNELIEILEVSEKSPGIPVQWVTGQDITALIEQAEKYLNLKMEYEKHHKKLTDFHHTGYFNLNAEFLKTQILSTISTLKLSLNETSFPHEQDIVKLSNSVINGLTSISEKITLSYGAAKSITEIFDISNKYTFSGLESLCTLLDHVIMNPKPTEAWFDPSKYSAVKKVYNEARNKYSQINGLIHSVTDRFDSEIFELDFHTMLRKFKVEYSSWFKVFNKNYRKDKKLIRSLYKGNSKKIDDQNIITILSELKEIQDRKSWLQENDNLLRELLGSHYLGELTDWERLNDSLDQFSIIIDWFSKDSVPEKLKNFLCSSETNSQGNRELFEKVGLIKESDILLTLQKVFSFTTEFEKMGISDLLEIITNAIKLFQQLERLYTEITKYSNQEISYDEAIDHLSRLEILQLIDHTIEDENESLKKNYENFFIGGIQTDWNSILDSLSWTGKLKEINEKYTLPQSFIIGICSNTNFVKKVSESLERLKSSYSQIEVEWKWYADLFVNKEELQQIALSDISLKINNCLNNISSLEEWIDFRSCRDKCNKEGLSEYVQKVEELKIDKDLIVDAFLKRFYRLWVDSVILKFPTVNSFRSRSHAEIIQDFSRLDLSQLSLARTRVKERLVSKLPDPNLPTTSIDEVGILKRELSKQRKLLPLRKLFKSIPNLMLTLKPCVMMSPLSVSLFLEADKYKFDLVIFDEASQVCTEDAIGAIMRGKQVIIAGDNKQLPPTSFFSANTSEADYDIDSVDEKGEYDDSDAFESILDESIVVLPERTLRWHYRSRHEHLIAFSNAKIYNYNLITFPSHIDKVPDHGVEYIYVENGVYDRGGKKCNVNEALEVAKLVLNHFDKFPNRSLGVVTFSESQQQAVETALRQLRLQNQDYERYFNEEKEEAFFIKNLENVQGDERDTIIFSIGYAKDPHGVMYMNFGPLSRDGGYRRLNVAITRAKYNVKLVGSIRPTDIKLESTKAEGVKMLRSYIEFAMNGPEVLQQELSYSDTVNVDSPFEESVYDFLLKQGYRVSTQVGCSGYRIDLAVKHPTLNGRFVLGVECDGATYHSARTARERDRLRQTVLEDIGWKIYRIWSTDWIKDPVTEGKKLLEAVEKATKEYVETGFKPKESEDRLSSPKINIEVLEKPMSNDDIQYDNPYSFAYYKEANIHEVKRNSDNTDYFTKVIHHVVQIEHPIHFELLCKRVAGLFGNQKVTVKIRKSVSFLIDNYLEQKLIRKGEFIWIKDKENLSVRIPLSNDTAVRAIHHICTEELSAAMHKIVSNSIGITSNDLYLVTARAFGFSRTGGNILQAMENACQHLIQTGVVQNLDGKIVLLADKYLYKS
ncbi:DUF4011 domain-containing protein [Paenibacillus sp. 1-18]|uniref:DUF4011 domain-containing protein n=1 Tax=Paenibacillus sp. 1-18 TaxID=1333846 RepID=UPI000471BDDE|nr:DUF3320 domain-containing protein [Paenibacillus sp. 1-18]